MENFHITLRFIGAWPGERLSELTATLEAMPKPSPFEIAIAGLNFFPNRKVLSAGIRAPHEIGDLASREDVYSPHLTVARIGKENTGELKNIGELRKEIASMSDTLFGTFKVMEFHLFLSKPTPGGSVYSRLASFPLGKTA